MQEDGNLVGCSLLYYIIFLDGGKQFVRLKVESSREKLPDSLVEIIEKYGFKESTE